jgi:hypothetical protein
MRTLAILLTLCCGAALTGADISVPLLELKQDGDEWRWFRGEEVVERGKLAELFESFAAHTDAAAGWTGKDESGHSNNLLVLNIDAAAPADILAAAVSLARDSGIMRVAIGSSEEIKTNPSKTKAPDAVKLDAAYTVIETRPGVSVTAGEATLQLWCSFDDNESRGSYSLSVGDGAKTEVPDSMGRTLSLTLLKKEKAAVRKQKLAEHKRIQTALTKAIKEHAANDKLKVLEITCGPDDTPWVFQQIAGRAVEDANAARPKAAGKLEVSWALSYAGELVKAELRALSASNLAALEWLEDHQNREGYWSADGYDTDSTRESAAKTRNLEFVKPGSREGDCGWSQSADIGLTGLALLAFVGAGYDHKEGDYRAACRQAILYLRKLQDNDGCFGPKEDKHYVYCHAMATVAMAQAYGLSGDAVLKPMVSKACEFILSAQNPGMGWRYGVKTGENDTSVTSWMLLALKSAKLAGVELDTTKSYTDAAAWFKLATTEVDGAQTCGYDQTGGGNARLKSAQAYTQNSTMNAIYIFSMLTMGKADLADATIKSMAAEFRNADALPAWDHLKIDYYYWHYGTLALYQVGGPAWKSWTRALMPLLLRHQRGYCDADVAAKQTTAETLDEHGSWDAVDAWGSAGGRVYSTAINAMTLQIIARAKRLE